MKIVATIEARMTSSRLFGKVLLPFLGIPSLEQMIERVHQARYIDEIVVATTVNKTDDPIVELCKQLDVQYYRGSENDVLERVLEAAKSVNADYICELTGDCPLIDPLVIDDIIISHISGEYDYSSNFLLERSFPIGLDTQIFATKILQKVSELTIDPIDRVHVSYFIYSNPRLFSLNGVVAAPHSFGPDIRVTLDTKEDYELIQKVFEALYDKDNVFTAKSIVSWFRSNPEQLLINKHIRQKAAEEG